VNPRILAIFLCVEGGVLKKEELRFGGIDGGARGFREEGEKDLKQRLLLRRDDQIAWCHQQIADGTED
jgi:hypothetical protein